MKEGTSDSVCFIIYNLLSDSAVFIRNSTAFFIVLFEVLVTIIVYTIYGEPYLQFVRLIRYGLTEQFF